ncbi:MAG: DUF2283 domain-containing protein [Candidatus Diapherotrites archaeon]
MRIRYDEKNDAMYIRFSEAEYFESDEVKDGLIVDYDKDGKILGLEILDVSENLPKNALPKIGFVLKEPEKAVLKAMG